MNAAPRLWLARLDGPLPPGAEHWLDATEAERLQRFLAPAERRRRRLAWSLRRWALSQACPHVAEAEWRFVAGPHGKPALGAPFAQFGLEHNLSHGGAFAAVLIADAPCGVDVEAPPAGLEGADLVFGPEERAAIAAHARPSEAFLQFWVAKEAVLKCIGTGFATAPERLALRLAPDGRSASVRSADGGPTVPACLQISLWPLQDGHWLAAAISGTTGAPGPMPVPWQGP